MIKWNFESMFQKARKNRIYQDVVDQIEEAILDGKLNVGDTLPPERDLIEKFETSRGTLREALRVLEQKGLIEMRLGTNGGAVIKGLTTEKISENLALLIRFQQVSLEHLAEFREGVEGNVVALAAERATPSDIRHLRLLLEEARRYKENGISDQDAFIRVDEYLHQALARISRNPMYTSILQTLHENIHPYFENFLPREPHVIEENFGDLCDIVQAVEIGDAQKARKLAQLHVRRFNQYMIQNKQQKTSGGNL
ncbi:MAG: FadR/GntR family transcriptional regulator [Desulfatirhabdiaceae bacterium]|jgi:DNA-binding FadR family transcriptional regulator|nr:FadR/GntR family transcriptional regulator [Desulfatirhabdiaceae bacterium]